MRRREFISLLGGTLAAQAIPANAQEPIRVRTVGVLMGFANDAEAKAPYDSLAIGVGSGELSRARPLHETAACVRCPR
jgi:hypothetical protein